MRESHVQLRLDGHYSIQVDRPSGPHEVRFRVQEARTSTFRCRCYVGPGARLGGGNLLLFLHGIFDDDAFGTRQDGLSDYFRFVAADLPGHGDSGPTDGGFGLDLAGQGVAELPYLRPANGRALLVGYSLGGLVALAAAAHAPPTVAGVCLIDPPLVMVGLDDARTGWEVLANQRGGERNDVVSAICRDVLGMGAYGGDPDSIDFVPGFSNSRVPSLVIAGSPAHGSLTRDSDLERARAASGERITIVRVDGGHTIWSDNHPSVVRVILDWWARLGSGTEDFR